MNFAQIRQRLTKHRSQYGLLAFAVVFSVFGGIVLLVSGDAATPTAGVEVEAGNVTSPATTVTDSSASGGSAVKFVAATEPGSCPKTKRTVTAADVSTNKNSGYPAGTQLYVPGGPDPWGGCFPNADNTGIPAGTTLTPYSGSCVITAANTTITGKTITCDLHIQANNVTVKNSKIASDNIWVDSGSFTLMDSEVDFGDDIDSEGLSGSNFTVLRANMYGGKRQFYCDSHCTLQDSYLHDQLADPSGTAHESAARVEQYTTLTHNTLWCNAPDIPPDAGCSANQTGYPDFTTIHDNTMEKNLYMATTSGGYCSYGGATGGKPYSNNAANATNIHSINNVFQRGTSPNDKTTIALSDKRRYTCGHYGATTAYDPGKAGFIFTGNMWDDGLLFANDTTYPYSFLD